LTVGFESAQYSDYLLQVLIDNWSPPHAYLVRRSAAEALDAAAAWHPDSRVVSSEREYLTIAALMGMAFLYLPDAAVRYNTWSAGQLTTARSPAARAAGLADMFARFRRWRDSHGGRALEPAHEFLLGHDRGRWVRIPDEVAGDPSPVIEATRRYAGAFTLEDHARLVTRVLWHDWSRAGTRSASSDVAAAAAALIKIVAHRPADHVVISDPRLVAPALARRRFLSTGPFYTPLFGQCRYAVVRALDELRERGHFERAPTPPN
jgi:hypothetical protein